MIREVVIGEWTFKAAAGRNAPHVCAWAPGSDVKNHVPDVFIKIPRGKRTMGIGELREFCITWLFSIEDESDD